MAGFEGFRDDLWKMFADAAHEEAAQALADQARESGVPVDEIKLTLRTDSPKLRLDPVRVRQMAKQILGRSPGSAQGA